MLPHYKKCGNFLYNISMIHLDPYRQSFIYFKWGFWSVFILGGLFIWGCAHIESPLFKILLDNVFVYLPNYLTHEFSHRFWAVLGWEWWTYASGNGMETLIPLILCFWALRLKGGRLLQPVLLYWLATTLYGAGIYCADARAMKLPLTSSDMMTSYSPGAIKGDWVYILEPLGLLNYDVIIGHILMYMAVFFLLIAVWSVWYYWTHYEQYLSHTH